MGSDLRSVLRIRLRLPVLRFRLSPTYTYTYSSPGLLWPLPTFLPPNFFISHYYTCSTTRMLTSIGALSPTRYCHTPSAAVHATISSSLLSFRIFQRPKLPLP